MKNVYINYIKYDVLNYDISNSYRNTPIFYKNKFQSNFPSVPDIEINMILKFNESNYMNMMCIYDSRNKIDILCGDKMLHGCYITTINSNFIDDDIIDNDISITFKADYYSIDDDMTYMKKMKHEIRKKKLESL